MAVKLDELTGRGAARIGGALGTIVASAASRYSATRAVSMSDDDRAALMAALRETYFDAASTDGQPTIDGEKSWPFKLATKAIEDEIDDFLREILEGFINQWAALKVQQILETTRNQITEAVRMGQEKGLSVEDIAKLIVDEMAGINRYRAAIIARTESHSAAQYTQLNAVTRSGVDLLKTWNSADDHRTRDFGESDGVIDAYNHRIMDGVQVPADQPFLVPARFGVLEPLMFPGDPQGSAGNIINCRCFMTFERAGRER